MKAQQRIPCNRI